MRFYPFGSSSLNQLFNTTLAVTASTSLYAASSSFSTRVATASYAISGSPGINGTDGVCLPTQGPTGDIGPDGFTGTNGGTSVPLPT